MAKKRGGHSGGHGWFVTFADLMALMMSFFVMLLAFSTQDQAKMKIVAGSMRDAFGVQTVNRYSGVAELDGIPTKARPTKVESSKPEDEHNAVAQRNGDYGQRSGNRMKHDRAFALAAVSLRQAMADLPELTELSKQIVIEESKEGLNIEIADQDGRSMFPEGSREPYERTRRLIQRLAGPIKSLPNRVAIAGHTAAPRLPPRPDYGPWELSADRANAVRKVLEQEGVASARFYSVAGRADTQPLFPDDPHIAANRRVTITLMYEEPPLPVGFKP
jgi:chemotaxis protein MotB